MRDVWLINEAHPAKLEKSVGGPSGNSVKGAASKKFSMVNLSHGTLGHILRGGTTFTKAAAFKIKMTTIVNQHHQHHTNTTWKRSLAPTIISVSSAYLRNIIIAFPPRKTFQWSSTDWTTHNVSQRNVQRGPLTDPTFVTSELIIANFSINDLTVSKIRPIAAYIHPGLELWRNDDDEEKPWDGWGDSSRG